MKLVEPRVRYTNPSPAPQALLGTKDQGPPTQEEAVEQELQENSAPKFAGPETRISIASIEVVGGEVDYTDNTLTSPARTTVRDLSVVMSEFSFPDPAAKSVKINATLPEDSRFQIEGDLARGNNGTFLLTLQDLDLPTFDPYAQGAGTTLKSGRVSVKSRIKLAGRTTTLSNDLVLCDFGSSFRDPSVVSAAIGMPVDVALALLRDPAGAISLAIPVKIDDRGARVSLATVVASALKAATIGAVTAPLKILGATLGKDGLGGLVGMGSGPSSGSRDRRGRKRLGWFEKGLEA